MPRAITFLLLANTSPLFGIFFFDWSIFSILFFYWVESFVIGLFSILKIAKAKNISHSQAQKIQRDFGRFVQHPEHLQLVIEGTSSFYTNVTVPILVLFFIFHFGAFIFLQGMLLFDEFGPPDIPVWSMAIAALSLFISHGISYLENYIGKNEYLRVTPISQIFTPYIRIFAMFIGAYVGGYITTSIGSPKIALILTVFLKLFLDIISYQKLHAKLSPHITLEFVAKTY